jgi:hypothetical protein
MKRALIATAFCAFGMYLAGAPAAVASPGDDAVVVTVPQTIPGATRAGVPVDCGPDRRAIGGGAAIGPISNTTNGLLVSNPLDSTGTTASTVTGDVPRYWYTAVENENASISQDFNFYAVCSANSDATVQAVSFTVPHATTPPFTAMYGGRAVPCPTGQRAIGGGLGYTNTLAEGHARIDTNGPLSAIYGRPQNGEVAYGWLTEAVNWSTTTDLDYRAFAICSASSQATLQTAPFSTYNNGRANAVCPSGGRALSGGLESTDFNEWFVQDANPTDAAGNSLPAAGGVAQGWSASVRKTGTGESNFTVSAICEPGPPSAAPLPGPTGQRAAALKKCKKKHSKKARKKCRKKAVALPV